MDNKRDYNIEIVPYALPENEGKTCEIGIEKMTITYIQQDDTNHGGRDDTQTLTIETEDAICTREEALNKQGYYLVMKTDRWAVDEPEDLVTLLNDFKNRLYHNVEELKTKAQLEKAVEELDKMEDKFTLNSAPNHNAYITDDIPQ